jgi:two-component system, cell cycle sensor histidine kinase and response regulator CckA
MRARSAHSSSIDTGRLGYTVLEAPSGEKAIKVLAQNPGITLLLTDVVMPGFQAGSWPRTP